MTVRRCLLWPDPLLRKPAADVAAITDEVRAIWAEMIDTMDAMPGYCLAAVQIGSGLRLAGGSVGGVVGVAWFREPSGLVAKATDPPLSMLVPILVLSAAPIYFGIDTEASASIARKAAESLLGGLK